MEEDDKKKIMVAIDESECSDYALEWTLKNFRDSIENSKHLIFTVQPISELGYMHASSFGVAPPELIRSFQENQKKTSLALLEKAKDICSKYGVAPEAFTQVGDPKEAICEAVEKLNIHLLVLGSHGRKAIARYPAVVCAEYLNMDISGECQQLLRPPCQMPCSCYKKNSNK